MSNIGQYREVWAVDTEFVSSPSGLRSVRCLVAIELFSRRRIALWEDGLQKLKCAPFDMGPHTLIVAYYAIAELLCFLFLGWRLPANLLDLYAEFRVATNGLVLPAGRGLLGACERFGVDVMDAMHKDAMRDLVLRGHPYTENEQAQILEYCSHDVTATIGLFNAMQKQFSIGHALLRGRYVQSVALMERAGVPLDRELVERFLAERSTIKAALIDRFGVSGVFDGLSFRLEAFERYIHALGIEDWPRSANGHPKHDHDTFKQMAARYPRIEPLRQIQRSFGQLRAGDLAVGADGRNRAMLSPFSSVTGRNQPSTSAFIFGCPSWMRGFIRPESGMALAYLDYEQQELGIAAALSKDPAMLKMYSASDPYITLAAMAGAVPPGATKASHPRERELFKVFALGVQYGMTEHGLARQLNVTLSEARHLLHEHRRIFPIYWQWSDRALDCALLLGRLQTTFGWRVRIGSQTKNLRMIRNFPMQANGAEMLRIACILGHSAGVRIVAPVHDALLIEAPVEEIDESVAVMHECMAEASRTVLDGFALRTEAEITRYPDRWKVTKGREIWDFVAAHLGVSP